MENNFLMKEIPKTLSDDELTKLITAYQNGDKNAKETIITHNIRLVIFRINKRFYNTNHEKEELVSIGCMGLMKAVNTFDISKKTKFSSYATVCIDNEILQFLRHEKKHEKVDSLNKNIKENESDERITLEEIIADKYDFTEEIINKELKNIVRDILKTLNDRDKKIIMMYFGFNEKLSTQKEIATKLSISQSYVSRLIIRTIKTIKEKLTYYYNEDVIEETKEQEEITNSASTEAVVKQKMQEEKTNNKKTNNNSNKKQKNKKNKKVKKGENKMRTLKTIYDYLDKYSKLEIDEVIEELTDEEKALIELRYGKDLTHPVTSENWTKENHKEFYGNLIPHIKRKLNRKAKNNSFKKPLIIAETLTETKEEVTSEAPIKEVVPTIKTNNVITKEDYLKVLALLRSPVFTKLLSTYSQEEIIIVSLKLGYINNTPFSNEAIADFLNIKPQEVIETTKNVLTLYKEKIIQIMNEVINISTEENNIILQKK